MSSNIYENSQDLKFTKFTKFTKSKYLPLSLSSKPIKQDEFVKKLSIDSLRMKYSGIKGKSPNRGQLKLFIATLHFLLKVYKKYKKIHKHNKNIKIIIIYIGAAPGLSIGILDKYLNGPEWIKKWILYDMIDMDKSLNSKRFDCRKRYFTIKSANKFKRWSEKHPDTKIVYLTDIRITPDLSLNDPRYHSESDKLILENMIFDQDCILIIEPWMWWRKFRMPYSSVNLNGTTYISLNCIPSTILFQSFIGAGSTETRSYGTIKDIHKFKQNPNNQEFVILFKVYEEQLQYFNAKQRDIYIFHNLLIPGFCYCFDCNFYIYVIHKYFKIFHKKSNPTTKDIGLMILEIDSKMPQDNKLIHNKSPHGLYPLMSNDERNKKLSDMIHKYQEFKNNKNMRRKGQTSYKFKEVHKSHVFGINASKDYKILKKGDS